MAETLKILIEFISFLRENCPNIKSEKVCQDQAQDKAEGSIQKCVTSTHRMGEAKFQPHSLLRPAHKFSFSPGL
jgi:hypothetical protein